MDVVCTYPKGPFTQQKHTWIFCCNLHAFCIKIHANSVPLMRSGFFLMWISQSSTQIQCSISGLSLYTEAVSANRMWISLIDLYLDLRWNLPHKMKICNRNLQEIVFLPKILPCEQPLRSSTLSFYKLLLEFDISSNYREKTRCIMTPPSVDLVVRKSWPRKSRQEVSSCNLNFKIPGKLKLYIFKQTTYMVTSSEHTTRLVPKKLN